MKHLKIISLFIFSLILINCSSDDDNPSSPEASAIKGTWSDSVNTSGQILTAELSLDESSGVISGSGDVSYKEESGTSTKSFSFINSATGTIQSKDVVINVVFADSKFTFTGKLSNDNSTMSGTAVMLVKNNFSFNDGEYTFNMNLKKK